MLETAEGIRKIRGPVTDKLRTLAKNHVLYLIEGVEGATAHFELNPAEPRFRQAIDLKRDKYKQAVSGLIALGIRRGEFRKCNVKFAMRAFLGALNWTPHWYDPSGADSPDEIATNIAEYAVAGLQRYLADKSG